MSTESKKTGVSGLFNLSGARSALPRASLWPWLYRGTLATLLASTVAAEYHTFHLQSRFFNSVASGQSQAILDNPSASPALTGPYPKRLGYDRFAAIEEKLLKNGYSLKRQAPQRPPLNIFGVQLYPTANDEKPQAGLTITGQDGGKIYQAKYPRRVYPSFGTIPDHLVRTLLYAENRKLLDKDPAAMNPAIDMWRFAGAVMRHVAKKAGLGGADDLKNSGGASTLYTQYLKYLYSPGGLTLSEHDKLVQMLTAATRSYADGLDTSDERREIVLDYLNSMPLSSFPRSGEIFGIADGVEHWYGRDFDNFNYLLNTPLEGLNEPALREVARAWREGISLILANTQPSEFLLKDYASLQARVDSFIPGLVREGIVPEQLGPMILAERAPLADFASHDAARYSAHGSKMDQLLRIDFMEDIVGLGAGQGGLHALDRFDIDLETTLDAELTAAVTRKLYELTDPAVAQQSGLVAHRLLKPDGTDVFYTFNLNMVTPEYTVVVAQADNQGGQLNTSEDVKIELGSTAKLRVAISYFEVISELYHKYRDLTSSELLQIYIGAHDPLTKWAAEYIANPANPDKSLTGIIHTSMERKYSGSPAEAFITGGGRMTFGNYDNKSNGGYFSVREAFYNSINLPFVRILRDVVNYMTYNRLGVDPAIYTDYYHPERRRLLESFIDSDSRVFLRKYWNSLTSRGADGKARLMTPDEMLESFGAQIMARKTRYYVDRLAAIFRVLKPEAPREEMAAYISGKCPNCDARGGFQEEYDDYAPGKFGIRDLSHITKIHDLGIGLALHQGRFPDSTFDQAAAALRDITMVSYKWLMDPANPEKHHTDKGMARQNKRIAIMVERAAFGEIEQEWKQKRFGFDRMVQSLGSALGASGDTPSYLAQLMSALVNHGIFREFRKFSRITLGKGTQYEREFQLEPDPGQRIMSPEIASAALELLQGVVQEGTGERMKAAIKLSTGEILDVRLKTGTGDNRNGKEITSRTATIVFEFSRKPDADGRQTGPTFVGTVLAYVPRPRDGEYNFTSALPQEVLKNLVQMPEFIRYLDRVFTPETVPEPGTPTAETYGTTTIQWERGPAAPRPPAI